jgi:hypothetical protein
MPDYKAVLSKTIDGLQTNTQEMRSRVYEKARATIRRQLEAVQPPLSIERMNRESEALETAISEIEAQEVAKATPEVDDILSEPIMAPPPAEPVPAPPPAPEPAPDYPPVPQPSPVPTSELSPAASTPPPSAAAAPIVSQPAPAAPVDDLGASPLGAAAGVGAAGAAGDFPRRREEPRKSRKGLIIIFVLLLALIGGGFAISANRDAVNPMVQNIAPGLSIPFLGIQPIELNPADNTTTPVSDTSTAPDDQPVADTPAADATDDTAADDGSPKFDERLGSDGQTAEPTSPTTDELPVPADPNDDTVEGPAEGVPQPDVAPQAGVPDASQAPDSGTTGDAADAATPLVAQRAFYYVETGDNSGTSRTPGSLVWRNGERDGLTTIEADVSIADLGIDTTFVIRKNTDETLSASHVIEVLFTVPDNFSGGGIDNVRQVVLKTTEEAQGNALIAEPAKISDGFFLIALYDLPEARAANEQILQERDWIDLPIAYSTGRRALLTLEKGAKGNEVFRNAFNAWAN